MLDRLNLEEMRTQGTRWKHRRGALRALWIALGVVAVFILVIQTAATAQPPLTRNQEQTKDLILLILLIAFFILVIVAYLPIRAYNRNAARIKVQNAAEQGAYIKECLEEMKTHHPSLRHGRVDGHGLMVGAELVMDEARTPAKPIRDHVERIAIDNGLLILGAGESSLRFCPPLMIDRETVQAGLERFEASLTQAEHEAELL